MVADWAKNRRKKFYVAKNFFIRLQKKKLSNYIVSSKKWRKAFEYLLSVVSYLSQWRKKVSVKCTQHGITILLPWTFIIAFLWHRANSEHETWHLNLLPIYKRCGDQFTVTFQFQYELKFKIDHLTFPLIPSNLFKRKIRKLFNRLEWKILSAFYLSYYNKFCLPVQNIFFYRLL